jgi:hypothetical protein
MLLWLTTVDWQQQQVGSCWYCAVCDTYGRKEFPEEKHHNGGWGGDGRGWHGVKEEAKELQREPTIQALAEGSFDFNQTLTLLNDLMNDSKEDEWAKVQQTAHFMQGRAAVELRAAALRAAAAGKEPDDVSSHKKRKAGEGEGAGNREGHAGAQGTGP